LKLKQPVFASKGALSRLGYTAVEKFERQKPSLAEGLLLPGDALVIWKIEVVRAPDLER
jgi:hypothetical protein